MTSTVTQTISQKIEFLQEKGYWQNPAGDLTPPQLVEYVQMMMEANELTEEDVHVHFLNDVNATTAAQVPQEEEVEEAILTYTDFKGNHIKLNMDELVLPSSDQKTGPIEAPFYDDVDEKYTPIEIHGDVRISGQAVGTDEAHSRVITILTSKYKKELYKWFCEVGYGILETSDMTLSFPGIEMSSRAVGEIMHTIMDSNNHYRVTLDWVKESGTGPYPEFIIQGLRGQGDKPAMTTVRVHIRLG